jgi:hypothetical protein
MGLLDSERKALHVMSPQFSKAGDRKLRTGEKADRNKEYGASKPQASRKQAASKPQASHNQLQLKGGRCDMRRRKATACATSRSSDSLCLWLVATGSACYVID